MKNFFVNRFLMFLILLTFSAGCNRASNINKLKDEGFAPPKNDNPIEEESTDGGISAGGGGTLPANPIPIYKVYELVDLAKFQLRLYFNFQTRLFRNEQMGKPWSWFQGDQNLSTLLEKIDIEILEDRPCKDRFGRKADASIFASRPNTICLSAFRIAPKLVEEVANKEILALIAHEFSHLLGANENEAIELQKYVANNLQGVLQRDAEELRRGNSPRSVMSPMYEFEQLSSKHSRLKNLVEKNDLLGIRNLFIEIMDSIDRLRDHFGYGEEFSLLSGFQTDYLDILQSKLWINDTFVISKIGGANAQELHILRYEKCFPNGVSALASELAQNKECTNTIDQTTKLGDYKFNKLTKIKDLIGEMRDAFIIIDDIGAALRALAQDGSPTYFHSISELQSPKIEDNPWTKHQGRYRAELIGCETSDQKPVGPYQILTEINLIPDEYNYPVEGNPAMKLVESATNFSSTTFLANGYGAYHTQKLFEEGLGTFAEMEQGSRWYTHQMRQGWNKESRVIRKTETGLTFEKSQYKFSYDYKGVWENSQKCVYSLFAIEL